MEFNRSKMRFEQKKFREEYRKEIDGWYNGFLHVALIYMIGFLSIYYYLMHISGLKIIELFIIPITFLFCNYFEWLLHKEVMHKPRNFPGAQAIYTRHTLQHHQFFTEKEMRFADPYDWRVTFFPLYALAVFTLLSLPFALLLWQIFSANSAWLFITTTTGMYLIYEFMHFCCHVGDNRLLRNFPFVNTLRRHHEAHHRKNIMMDKNMNLTFPIADWYFETSDIDRSLIGTLFNGYSKKYLRDDGNNG